jgi:polyphenol oxidase
MADIRRLNESRRHFLAEIGVGMGAASLFGAGFLSWPPEAGAQTCAAPGPLGTPRVWLRDCRPIRPRRPASTLSSAEVEKLREAYKAMRDLSVSDPADPRGFAHQANVHCWSCGGVGSSIQVHGNWQFFAWHRAYLYFHERILGKLIGDMDFRLPYWDWDSPSHRKLPPGYATPADSTNPLFNDTRSMDPNDELPDEDVGTEVMQNALTAADFTDFGGSATSSGIPEGAPHGSVHVDVGGDMGAFGTAARDPIFYAHHSNVDKMWSDWKKSSSTHNNPTSAAFLNLTFTFFDENRVWRSITAARVLDTEAQLRYVYGPSQFMEILPCLLEWVVIRPVRPFERVLVLDPRLRERLVKAQSSRAHVRMHFEGLRVPVDKSAIYRVYADREEAEADGGPGSSSYLGTVPVVLNDKDNRHPTPSMRRAVFNVTTRLPMLLERRAPLEFVLVERRPKGERRRVLAAVARAANFSIAEVE